MYDSFVFLYPHTAYTDHLFERLKTNRPDIDCRLVSRYFRHSIYKAQSLANRTVLITINQEDGQPNEISPLVNHVSEDLIIPTDVTGIGLKAPVADSDYQKIAAKIPGNRLLFGGFHSCDCLLQLLIESFALKKTVDIAMLTTDFYFDLLSFPNKEIREIIPFNLPISFPAWFSHFRGYINRTWETILGRPLISH